MGSRKLELSGDKKEQFHTGPKSTREGNSLLSQTLWLLIYSCIFCLCIVKTKNERNTTQKN